MWGGGIEICVKERIGTSTVKPFKDGLRTLGLIFNIIVLFRPMEVFSAIGISAIILSLIYGGISAFVDGLGVPVMAAVLCIFGIQTIFLGIICAQISKLRLENLDNC